LAEQAARVESLLWRVAELEPFAAEAPEKEETLRRQEEEIAGHMAMHAENGERIRSLQNHVIELQATTVPTEHFDRIIGEHQDEIRRQAQEHQQRIGELQQMLAIKDDEIAQHVAVRYSQAGMVSSLEARVTELEGATERVIALEKLLSERDSEIKELLAAHSELQTEMQSWRTHALELEPVAERTPKLEATIREQAAELQRLRDAIGDKDGQLTFLQERLSAISSRLMAHQHRLQQVEPLAARTPELEKQLEERERSARESIKSLEEQHYLELTRLKVNSAQRIRRFRQSLNGFKH
jgi:DNA repair ATPase RecN